MEDDVLMALAKHELGHVLGFGTIWHYERFAYLENPSVAGGVVTADQQTPFSGPQARAAFDGIQPTSEPRWAKCRRGTTQ